MQRALAFDRSPPLAVAFRFFLNVPAFLMLAALVLAWVAMGDTPYIRWNPGVLAAAHFVTLGVLASAMLGALMQILPVAAGIQVLHPRVTSISCHACLTLGTLALASGFLSGESVYHGLAMALLALAFLTFLASVTGGMLRNWEQRTAGSSEILVAVRLALLSLAITICLGLFMVAMRAGIWSPSALHRLTWLHGLPDLHAMWGLAGWIGLLVIGVSYQVIPIFQATELYPKRLTDTLAPVAFGLMVAYTIARTPSATAAAASILPLTILVAGALCFMTYGAVTAYLLWTRKRPSPEPTTWFWHCAMLALILAGLVISTQPWISNQWPDPGLHDSMQMLLGTLMTLGFGVSAVNGMLYKIVPFLLWHNAQRRSTEARPGMPKVKHFIAERDALRQFAAHFLALGFLGLASFDRLWLMPGAFFLAVSAALLAWNMSRALGLYRHALSQAS